MWARIFKFYLALQAAVYLFAIFVDATLDPIVIVGSHFFYKANGSEFFIRGVVYTQDIAASEGTSIPDPLADQAGCQRDIPYLQELRTNVVRVYAIDPIQDHSGCMSLLDAAGIYVLVDLSNRLSMIDGGDPVWDLELYASYTSAIDSMQNYTNVLGFFAGNEVITSFNTSNSAAFVKAAVRDMKSYIQAQGYRSIGIGYATNDDITILDNSEDYFNCGDSASSIDFLGLNIYSCIFLRIWVRHCRRRGARKGAREVAQAKAGFTKIVKFCGLAKAHGHRYAWMDTCCIDKRNSAELSEAINSMYRYYRDAVECLIYLSDVPTVDGDAISPQQQLDRFRASRWFTRGWTLQELLAPKRPAVDLLHCRTHVMGINAPDNPQRRHSVQLDGGIFNIHMPVLYGEGGKKAFRRLQEEIIRTSFDQSIFVWQGNYESSGFLAKWPSDFADTPRLGLWGPINLAPFTMTNVGLSIGMNITQDTLIDRSWMPDKLEEKIYLGVIGCDVWDGEAWVLLVVYLQVVPSASIYINGQFCKAYRRVQCNTWQTIPATSLVDRTGPSHFIDALVLEDEQFELINRASEEHKSRFPRE